MKASEEISPKPIINMIWDYSVRPQWQITSESTIPAMYIRNATSEVQNSLAIANALLQGEVPPDFVEFRLRLINEGILNGIALIEGEEKKGILVIAKNDAEKAKATRADGNALIFAQERIPTHVLKIPRVYGIVEMVAPIYAVYSIPVLVNEFLENYHEISCTATDDSDNPSLFVVNTADIQINTTGVPSTEQLKNEAIYAIAKAQTCVYKAFGNRIQRELRINAGDYVANESNGKINWGLITLRGGIDDTELSLEDFVRQTLLHEEHGFDIRIGIQTRKIQPFLDQPIQTLQGIKDGLLEMDPEFDIQRYIEVLDILAKEPKLPGETIQKYIDEQVR